MKNYENVKTRGNLEEAKNLYHDAMMIVMEVGSAPPSLNALVGTADLLRNEGEIEFALELLAFVIHHAASERDAEVRVEQLLLAESTSELPAEKARADREIGTSASLEETMATILGQKEQTVEIMHLRRETMKCFVQNLRCSMRA